MTLANRVGGQGGNLSLNLITLTGPASYVAGGFAVTADDCALGAITQILPFAASGYVPEYIASTGKVLVRWVDTTTDGAALAQVADGTNLGSIVFKALAYGAP